MKTLYIYSTTYDYTERVNAHNAALEKEFPDSGFNLFAITDVQFSHGDLGKTINTGVHARFDSGLPFTVEPRSSICKIPLRLANSRGIIDAGYRGELLIKCDAHADFLLEKDKSFFQVLSPDLSAFRVQLVSSLEELGQTARGAGGFGSTGGN